MRTADRVLSLLLALAAVVLGSVVVVEILGRAVGHDGHVLVPWEPVATFFRAHAWNAAPVLWISAALAALGLILLVAELKPRRPGLLGLQPAAPGVLAAVDRGSVSRVAVAAAQGVTGVDQASADVGARRLSVRVNTALHEPDQLREPVTAAIEQAMTALGLVATPDVTVRARGGAS